MILRETITVDELSGIEPMYFPDKIKFCIDRRRGVVAIGREMHAEMELELYDDGSDDHDIFGGNILLEPLSVEWEAHANIARNRELGIGSGRLLIDEDIKADLLEILTHWIR